MLALFLLHPCIGRVIYKSLGAQKIFYGYVFFVKYILKFSNNRCIIIISRTATKNKRYINEEIIGGIKNDGAFTVIRSCAYRGR